MSSAREKQNFHRQFTYFFLCGNLPPVPSREDCSQPRQSFVVRITPHIARYSRVDLAVVLRVLSQVPSVRFELNCTHAWLRIGHKLLKITIYFYGSWDRGHPQEFQRVLFILTKPLGFKEQAKYLVSVTIFCSLSYLTPFWTFCAFLPRHAGEIADVYYSPFTDTMPKGAAFCCKLAAYSTGALSVMVDNISFLTPWAAGPLQEGKKPYEWPPERLHCSGPQALGLFQAGSDCFLLSCPVCCGTEWKWRVMSLPRLWFDHDSKQTLGQHPNSGCLQFVQGGRSEDCIFLLTITITLSKYWYSSFFASDETHIFVCTYFGNILIGGPFSLQLRLLEQEQGTARMFPCHVSHLAQGLSRNLFLLKIISL